MQCLFITGFISGQLAQAICRTLIHSLWQGLLAAALVGIVILTTRRSRATLRYNLFSMIFAGFIATAYRRVRIARLPGGKSICGGAASGSQRPRGMILLVAPRPGERVNWTP